MLDRTHVDEAVVLSTCNRIEICAVVDAFHGGLGDVTDVLGGHAGFPIGELSDHLFVLARHVNDKGAGDVLWVPGQNR